MQYDIISVSKGSVKIATLDKYVQEVKGMKVPNAGEIIERLARENERQRIEIEQLKARIAELESNRPD